MIEEFDVFIFIITIISVYTLSLFMLFSIPLPDKVEEFMDNHPGPFFTIYSIYMTIIIFLSYKIIIA